MASKPAPPLFTPATLARALGTALALGAGLSGAPATTHAADASAPPRGAYGRAPSSDELAQQRYQEGLAAFEEGRFEEAATAFEDAFSIAGDPTLLYNVSIAYEKSGQLELALEALEQYVELAPESEREEIDRQRKALALRIERSRSREAGATEPEPATKGPAQPQPSDPTQPDPSEPDAPPKDRVFTPLAGSLLGATVVAAGVGIGLAVPASRTDQQVMDRCVNRGDAYLCEDDTASLFSRRRGLAIGADVAFGVSIAAGVATVAVLGINAARIRRKRETVTTAVVPTLGRRTAGIALTRRF